MFECYETNECSFDVKGDIPLRLNSREIYTDDFCSGIFIAHCDRGKAVSFKTVAGFARRGRNHTFNRPDARSCSDIEDPVGGLGVRKA